MPKETGSADFRVPRAVRLGQEADLAFEIDPAERGKAPPRLVRELDRGRNWLALEEPRIFSAAAPELLRGDETFALEAVEVRFSQQEGEGAAPSPALLVLQGPVREGTLRAAAAEPASPPKGLGLDALDNGDLRVALGHGMDVAMAVGASGDGLETYAWVEVRENGAQVPPEAWTGRLRQVHREATLEPVRPLEVLVRRWRPQAEPRESYFLVPLARIVLCAQMEVSREGGALRWRWEGVWRGEMRRIGEEQATAPIATPSPAVVRYSQFEQVRAEGGPTVWRALLSPVTVGVRYSGEALERFFD